MSDNSSSRKIGKGMIIAAWVMVLGLLTLYFGGVLDRQHNPNKTVHSRVGDEGQNEVVLKRNKFGHYVTAGQVNGVPVEFLVDTGATDVAIPSHLADRLGLKRGQATRYRTANGVITGYRTKLDSVAIGSIRLENVPASISPGMGDMDILLGMSVLKNVEFTQRGDELILRQ
jgi:aspartyl protease family protein